MMKQGRAVFTLFREMLQTIVRAARTREEVWGGRGREEEVWLVGWSVGRLFFCFLFVGCLLVCLFG